MRKSRLKFKLYGMMLLIALSALPMVYLAPTAKRDPGPIDIYGPVMFRNDGSVEVQRGMIRLEQAKTEVRADRIIIERDGTILVEGGGEIKQPPAANRSR